MRVGSCGAVSDKARHWWRKQRGPHTVRPISMVQHIKFSFTDKRHSVLLLVTLVLQQVVAEWEMAPLCLNHCSTYLFSSLNFSVAWNLKYQMQIETSATDTLKSPAGIYSTLLSTVIVVLSHVSHPGNINLLHTFWFLCWQTCYFTFQMGITERILLTEKSKFLQYSKWFKSCEHG